jgi:hypothetical protein
MNLAERITIDPDIRCRSFIASKDGRRSQSAFPTGAFGGLRVEEVCQ